MKTAAIISASLFALALDRVPAHAGRTGADEAVCTKAVLFQGEYIHGCMGTMKGFREHPDPNAYAEMVIRGNGQITFTAQINGVYFACVFADSFDAQYFASSTGGFDHTRFVIGARDGKCDVDGATLSLGSRHGAY